MENKYTSLENRNKNSLVWYESTVGDHATTKKTAKLSESNPSVLHTSLSDLSLRLLVVKKLCIEQKRRRKRTQMRRYRRN